MEELQAKIEEGKAEVGVVGLGYVGLPLALAFASRFTVVGYDPNEAVIDTLRGGRSHIEDIADREVLSCLRRTFYVTTDPAELAACDFIIICVPTPLVQDREPDLSHIRACAATIAAGLRQGQFVILESTTYPGTTDEVLVPLLERSGLKAGIDFGVAYSQERIDPGNRQYRVQDIPKVVGGLTPQCTDIAAALYGTVIATVVKVRDCRTAEACKILENVFRSVNIALINEMALIFERMNINTWEVVAAAATKPFGFMPFYPGPGVGGHCIPLDPFYLAYKARQYGIIPRFIELSGEINDFMRVHVANLAERGLALAGRRIDGAQLAVLGLTYKKEVDDTRESPARKVVEEIVERGGRVKVYDPHARKIETRVGCFKREESLEEALRGADGALFLVDHNQFRGLSAEYLRSLMGRPVIIDCRNLFDAAELEGTIYLGLGKPQAVAEPQPLAVARQRERSG